MKKLLLALVLLCSLPSWALIPQISGYRSTNGTQHYDASAWRASQDGLIALFNSTHSPSNFTWQYGSATSFYFYSSSAYTGYYGSTATQGLCPTDSTISGSQCACTSPKVEDPTHTSCVAPNACAPTQGTTVSRNFTMGYSLKRPTVSMYPSYKPDGSLAPGGYLGEVNSGDSVCVDSCTATVGSITDAWSSTEPTATGFYRFSEDHDVTFNSTGLACTSSTAQTSTLGSSFATPACVGFVGQVNGRTTCVPTVGDTSSRGVSSANSKIGNPTSGTTGGAGNIPSSGGNGGNAGGPASSSDGGMVTPGGIVGAGPAGTASAVAPSTPASGVEAACGAPGEPQCAIKEDGTPNAPDASIAKAADGYNRDSQALLGTVGGINDKAGLFSGWGTLFSAPAVVACTPFVLPEYMGGPSLGSINPCPVVDGVRSVMGYIWALTGMILCLGMIRKVI